ncbi:nSTAND1 domain-containing NTPase [Sorangium sp. So ce1389]|uniref:nSTAND1 domain-containing NTPase n=1 Tax=Sorangium sp. So ce1389 TaxID=3133336 RepID=UPI003F5D7EF4
MNQATLAPGTVFQGRYEVLSLIRQSGSVFTYQGQLLATGKSIVLKVVRPLRGGMPAVLARLNGARFLRRMRSCARLDHPSIVRPIDAGQTDEGQLYAVFELVPGQSLGELLTQQGALEPPEARRLMLQVLDALGYAHLQGMVHGDLQPSHVMVVPTGALRNAMVLDFGFGTIAAAARAGRGGARASGELVARQAYAAPEQLRGYPPTPRSDLFAWGLLFLECLTGERAACGSSPASRGPVRMPPALREHPLGAILQRATIEDVTARVATAHSLLRELDACEVSGLRREELIKPCAPKGAEETETTGEMGGESRDAEEPCRPDAEGPQRSGCPTSPEASVEESALTPMPAAEAAASLMSSDRARGAVFPPGEAAMASTELIADRMPVGPDDKIKHYEIIRKLGRGGMGVVFLARDMRLGRLVAIKLLLRYSGRSVERFLAEARTTALCRHENIVVIHEVDEIQGYPYIVLEYIKGRTLREWMAGREQPGAPGSSGAHTTPGPRTTNVVIELMIPVVRALICAHEHRIVHRDLKPENILLDDAGSIKVVDFGIAKQTEAEVVSTLTSARAALAGGAGQRRKSAAVGTPRYMAPEQLLGTDVDHRADLWAVGILLYELLTGAHPLEPFSFTQLSNVVNLDVPMPSVSERRPDVGALGAVVDRCLKKHRAERIGSAKELLAELEALLPGRKAPELGEGESPFAGLAAFQESDAPRFFGRDRDVTAVTVRLRNQELLAVTGPSGAGKSSFVRAGVIPALKRSGDSWGAFILRPGRRPLSALVDVLAQVAESDLAGPTATAERSDHDGIVATLRAQPGYLGARLRARCRREGKSHHILLFVDQFEELYTLGAAPDERAAFVACLEGAADDASSPLRVLLAIRSDFLDRMADERHFMTKLTRGLWFLPPMSRDGLREGLTRPIETAGHRFETAEMIERMLDTLESTRSPLPLLQFTAVKLWEARDRERRLLTRGACEQLGGVAGALSAHADAVLAGLSWREQRLARAVFLRLVTPERTRAMVSMEQLCELAQDGAGGSGDAVAQLVQHLAGARLLLIETGGEREGTIVELVHESLIDRWAKLGQWLTESEQDAQFLARLRAAAQQWEASGRAEGLLWRDRAAQDARAWHERRRAEQGADWRVGLGRREEHYLLAVVALCERARHQRRRITTGVIATLGAVALMFSYLANRADQQAMRAEQQAARAEQETTRAQAEGLRARNSTRMAVARELQADPTTVLAILREIEPPNAPREWSVLARWALHSGVARAVLSHPNGVMYADYSPDGKRIVTASLDKAVRVWSADGIGEPLVLRGHESGVLSADFSPDGKRIVTASADKTVRVWSADGTGRPLVLRGHEDSIHSAAFSPDGNRIVSASEDKTVRVWSADGTGHPLILRGHEEPIYSAAFSPDGKRVATASWDKTVRIWNADGTGRPLVLRGHEDGVLGATFSPDGKRIATGSWDKTVRVWNADGTGRPLVLRGHEDGITPATFSPDGKRIVSASQDRTVRVWNADGTGEPLVLRGHGDRVFSATFSPDGKRIVSASYDKTARVWDADGVREPKVLRGHQAGVYSTAFSPDGKRIASTSYDNTARVWDADGAGEPLILRGHQHWVYGAEFSPDGKRIVTASQDKTVRVWNADSAGELLVLRGHDDGVRSAAFSPDGKRIVTASQDRTVRVWNADSAGELLVLRGHEDSVRSAAFSPDGKRIVTGSDDWTVRVWNADSAGELLVLRGHEAAVRSVAFSPDGKRIVTGSHDRTVRVWNVDGTGGPQVLRGHEHWIHSVAFSPDGKRVASGSQDKTVRVWNMDDLGQPLVLRGSDSPILAVEFSPDGKRIVSGSDDWGVRVWTDLEPLHGVDDPRLWAATTYCMPIERMMDLLGVTEATARVNQEVCLRRVTAAREPWPDRAGRPSGSGS